MSRTAVMLTSLEGFSLSLLEKCSRLAYMLPKIWFNDSLRCAKVRCLDCNSSSSMLFHTCSPHTFTFVLISATLNLGNGTNSVSYRVICCLCIHAVWTRCERHGPVIPGHPRDAGPAHCVALTVSWVARISRKRTQTQTQTDF